MKNNTVFDYVVKLIETTFGKENLSKIDFVFAYAKLALMNDGVLDVLFTNKADRADVDRVRSVFFERKLDPELLKSGIPILGPHIIDSFESMDSLLSLFKNEKTATDILIKILDSGIPELNVMQTGKNIDDVLNMVKTESSDSGKEKKKRTVKNKKKESVAKEREEQPSENETKATTEPEAEVIQSDKERLSDLIIKTNHLYESLKRKVYGQDEAIKMFSDGYFQSQVFNSENIKRQGPSASFLFAGPPGVGKTLLASSVAEILDMPFKRLDMSEYSKSDSVQRLSGIPKTFRTPKAGELTGFVDQNPKSIILLDEIEKAHIDVIYQFLQILDGGSLTDEYMMKTVDFSDVLLIFTTNVGKKLYEDTSCHNLSSIPRSVVMKEIENEVNEYGNQVFPSAICSRFAAGNVIMFNRLGIHNLISIIKKCFDENVKHVKELYGYDLVIDERVAPMLLFSQSTRMDARNMSSQSSILIKNELYDLGRHTLKYDNSLINVDKIKMSVSVDRESDPYVESLFVNNGKSVVLYVGDQSDFSAVFKRTLSRMKIQILYSSRETVLEDISKNDIAFVLINLKYDDSDNEFGYLSLDDIKNDSVRSFDLINEKVPDIPVYFVHKQDIRNTDTDVFLERGAREFIKWDDDSELISKLSQISNLVYMQARVDELSGRGRVLTYNSAQQIEGNEARIIFYDLKVAVAADADEGKMLLSDNERPKDRFADVIGAENAKSELKYFVDYLKNPKMFLTKSIKPPKGILLYGPPGTGKTMLARAMAGESDVSFIPYTATSFMKKYVGEGEESVRKLFLTAKKFAPSIIFIDEIDAIGKKRTGSENTHHTESLLNALLTEMDGFEFNPSKPVFVVAATNYGLDSSSNIGNGLDPALLRRFDNRIYVDLPKEKEREKYILMMLKKAGVKTVPSSVIHNVAQRTTGQSLAILKNIIELAMRNSNKSGVELDGEILLNALEEYMYGEKREWSEEYYNMVAVHEAGHAYISYISGEKPSFVTIVSRGDFGGYMQHENSEDHPSYTKDELIWKIRISLAGRVAETVFFGEKGINTGVGSDIRAATNIAWQIINDYAMSDSFACITHTQMLSSSAGNEIHARINDLLSEEMKNTEKLVREGKKKIKSLADFLRKNNQATEKEIIAVFEK